ncbi:Golgi integral membrane protein 4 [Columba livia]|nr:Golgi integral membrane protein 4 [Columba livia]
MGTGMCSRRQKGLLQTGFCLVTVACLGSGVFMYNHLQQKVRNAEAVAQKYKQQQEALSAQLQVVYEHRSRLERSLQKERGEHKKTKEDFLVYKLEAQEALNKEKQDSMNRYGALSSQHKILKNQHEDVKKQLLDLQLQHNSLKLEHRKTLETHSQKYAQLQQERDSEVTNLQDTVYKLREESKLLRKAHQEVHSQLLNAQVVTKGGWWPQGAAVPASYKRGSDFRKHTQAFPVNQENHPLGNPLASQVSGVQKPADGPMPPGQNPYGMDGPRPQASVLLTHPVPLQDANSLPDAVAAWPARHGDGRVIRFTRTMNSLPNGNPDLKMVMRIQVKSNEESQAPGLSPSDPKQPSAAENPPAPENHHSTGSKQTQMKSWKDIVNKVNTQMDEEQVPSYPKNLHFDPKQEMQNSSPQPSHQKRREEHQTAHQGDKKERTDDEELEMDAGVIEREENFHSRKKETVVQEPLMPDDAADPAQDPNNQGEDEFEEAELERPDFEEKAGDLEKFKEPSMQEESREKPLKDAGRPAKPREDPLDDYQDDQEQEIEDHGGEVDDNDDLEVVQDQKDHAGVQGNGKKEDYY